MVDELIKEDLIKILEGLRDKYEVYYKVKIIDDVIKVVVELLIRYILDRYLLDKVIDLIDEVVLKVRLKENIFFLEIKKLELEIENIDKEKEEVVRC